MKNGVFHFIEVKSVTRETTSNVIHETNDYFKPEEQINNVKMLHMKRAIEHFLAEYNLYKEKIQIDLITVIFFKSGEVPRINFIENI